MAGKGIKAGEAYVSLYMNDSRLVRGLRSAERKLRRFGANIAQVGSRMAMTSGVILAPLGLAVRQFAKMGDEVAKMAQRTGLSVEAVSGLRFAASQTGTSIEGLEKGLRRMQRSIYDASRGLSTQTDALNDLGLTYKDLDGLAPEEQFKVLAQAISEVEDPSRKAALAQAIFGRAGTELIPLMNQGAEGINAYIDKAKELGIVFDDETSEAAVRFTDMMDRLGKMIQMVAVEIGSALAPSLTEAGDKFQEVIESVRAWIEDNGDLIVTIAKLAAYVGGAGVALLAIGKVIGAISGILMVARGAVLAFNAVLALLSANPVILILAAIAAAVGGIVYLVNKIRGGRESGTAEDLSDVSNVRQELADAEKDISAADKARRNAMRDVASLAEREAAAKERTAKASEKIADNDPASVFGSTPRRGNVRSRDSSPEAMLFRLTDQYAEYVDRMESFGRDPVDFEKFVSLATEGKYTLAQLRTMERGIQGMAATGTFGGARGLAGGTGENLMRKTADASQKTVQQLVELNRKADDGGLVFGPS